MIRRRWEVLGYTTNGYGAIPYRYRLCWTRLGALLAKWGRDQVGLGIGYEIQRRKFPNT